MELTVSQFLEAVNLHLRQQQVTVYGEVTGRINRRGGVTYFTIHDQEEDASMTCMGFNSIMDKLGIELEEGMVIKVSGYPEIWKRNGMFSFKAFQIMLAGEGTLKRQFEALKRKLETDGLFSEEYKKPLPSFIKSLGLITAEGREAQNDFLKHLTSVGISVNLYDVRVEGASAVEQVCEAIAYFNQHEPETEVLVITRGGGSMEALQAFNSEDIARAIFASRIPVISAIGHERDVTIADFVADVRASTPTDAAKIISADWQSAPLTLQNIAQSLNTDVNRLIAELRQTMAVWNSQVQQSIDHTFKHLNLKLLNYEHQLTLSNPELKLKQGYAIVRDSKNKIIKNIADIADSDIVEAQFAYGKTKLKRI
ncbi:MAG: exodeoxyribonuclease VII large subunit [Patescibacteria group bacterium]